VAVLAAVNDFCQTKYRIGQSFLERINSTKILCKLQCFRIIYVVDKGPSPKIFSLVIHENISFSTSKPCMIYLDHKILVKLGQFC